jgi:hypothetical protein
VIIGAKVTITDIATNISNAATTDERGYYIFNGLHPVTYNLKAEMAGFRAEENAECGPCCQPADEHRLDAQRRRFGATNDHR